MLIGAPIQWRPPAAATPPNTPPAAP
jgi:hypothetical protein